MLLLAVDTSGKNGSIALAQVAGDGHEVEIIDAVSLTGGTFSAQLIPQLSSLLTKHGKSKSDIGAFAAVSGPGSFTGLRVGLAAIKALAETLGKPVAAVSLLEAIACSGNCEGRVLAALDAGRREVYVGDYEITCDKLGSRALLRTETLMSTESFQGEARSKLVLTPDAALADILTASGISAKRLDPPTAADVAHIGWQHLQRGQIVSPDELEANYIRRSDAEIFSKPRP
jgi:tRNA threonylcarbamoyladenosine biosynthesis protein TsaB